MKRHPVSALLRGGLPLAALAAASLLACCGGGKGKEGAPAAAPRQAVAVEALPLAPARLEEAVEATGTLSARKDAEVKSELGGTVENVYVTEWDRVRKGTPLAKVDTREAEAVNKRAEAGEAAAKAAVLEAEAALSRARREKERSEKLLASGLATRQSVDDAATQVEAAEARQRAAMAQVAAAREDVRQSFARLSKGILRAPFDGVVAARLVNPGEVVGEMQKVVFRVVDNRLLDLEMTVPSSEMGRLREGEAVSFAVDSFPGRAFPGKVRRINPVVSEADRSVRVSAEVRNDPEVLRAGLFARARIVLGVRDGVLLVPRPALTAWDTASRKGRLFVVEGGAARLRPVETGVVQGELVEVRSGAKAGDRVVTRGGFNLRDGDPVSVAEGGGGTAPAAVAPPAPPAEPAAGAPAPPAKAGRKAK